MNNAAPNDPVPEAIAEAAAAWVLRCDRGLTPGEQDEFLEWLAADPRHGEQLTRHRRHWDRLASLAQWCPEHSARPNPDLLAPSRRTARKIIPLVVLAAAAVIAVGIFFFGTTAMKPVWEDRSVAISKTVKTVALSTERVLEDGTVVELNSGAVLTAHFTPAERRVKLEKGEAHFKVTKNPTRPFVVSARGMDVHAVGTAFNVRLDAASVEVLVTEGRVKVSEGETGASTTAESTLPTRPALVPMLEAGQRAVVSLGTEPAAPKIATLTPGEIERVLAWQHRMLEFTAAPMAEVVAEFNRRNPVQLVITDPVLAGIEISASFRSDNIEGFVHLVEVGFGAQAERTVPGEIRLRRAR